MFWQQGRTHCLQLAKKQKKGTPKLAKFVDFLKIFLWGLCRQCLFFCGRLANFQK
jgi:hypothetical protein